MLAREGMMTNQALSQDRLERPHSNRTLLPRCAWMSLALSMLFELLDLLVRLYRVLRYHVPFSSPVLPFHHFRDFTCFLPRMAYLHTPMFFVSDPNMQPRFTYPAPVIFLYKLFYATGDHRIAIFFTLTSAVLLTLIVIFGRFLTAYGVASRSVIALLALATLTSFPLWFEYDLGNTEIWIFFIMVASLLCFFRRHFALFAVLIGIAASMKIFPFIYLALLLPLKRYREIVLGAVTIATANLLGLWYMGPTISAAYRGIQLGLAEFRDVYTLHFNMVSTQFDHSIWGLIRSATYRSVGFSYPPRALTLYLAATAIFGLALYFFVIRRLPLLNQLLCLCICMIVLPPISHDYTLLHLYFPWALLIAYAIEAQLHAKPLPKGFTVAFVCFAITFASEGTLTHHGIGISGQLKCVALLTLLFVALRNPWKFESDSAIFRTQASS